MYTKNKQNNLKLSSNKIALLSNLKLARHFRELSKYININIDIDIDIDIQIIN
jgi:hypothetical protein